MLTQAIDSYLAVRGGVLRTCARVEEGGAVSHAEGDHMLCAQAVAALARVGAHGVATAGGLETEHAAAGSGNANGAAGISAVRDGDDAGCDHRGRSA